MIDDERPSTWSLVSGLLDMGVRSARNKTPAPCVSRYEHKYRHAFGSRLQAQARPWSRAAVMRLETRASTPRPPRCDHGATCH